MRRAASRLSGPGGRWSGGVLVVAGIAVCWRDVLFQPHAIASGDLFTPFTPEAFRALFAGFWNPLLEFPNIETIDRLAFVAPFLLLGDPDAAQAAMIAVAIFGAGLAMFLAARHLGAPWILAVLAGVVYACNPWIANRVQHVFLLPGYAVLPALVALAVRPPSRHAVLWTVLLLTVGSTTPHTTVALLGVVVVFALLRRAGSGLVYLALVLGAYLAVNVWWWLPVGAFLSLTDIVPSWPTWELVQLFSRNAHLSAVLRLEGYWWPLADVDIAPWLRVAGLGLAGAALVGAARRDRARIACAAFAAGLAVLAMGTRGPGVFGPLVLDTPLADRLGWLLRDPNKLVGPLAAFLLLAAAGARLPDARTSVPASERGGDPPWSVATRSVLLGAYLLYSATYVSAFAPTVYRGHPIPEGIVGAAEWLSQREGRAAWMPAYFGSRTFWNGEQLTPEVASYGSPVPVLSLHGYDERARRAFLTLDFGALLGDSTADPKSLMQRWGVRWLVHHRDVLPGRMQAAGSFDPRVEMRSIRLGTWDLPVAAEFPGVTVFEAAPLEAPRVVTPMLTARPTAAAAALSAFGDAGQAYSAVGTRHQALDRMLLLPGDAREIMLAQHVVRVDLARSAPHSVPESRWSRYSETDLGWWPFVAARGGMPPVDSGAVVATRRADAELHAPVDLGAGRYDVWIRAYHGPDAGAVRLGLSPRGGGSRAPDSEPFPESDLAGDAHLGTDETWILNLEAQAPAMAWTRLGEYRAGAGRALATLQNLYGNNVIADLRLLAAAGPEPARVEPTHPDTTHPDTTHPEPTWLWTHTPACRNRDSGDRDLRLVVEDDLPWSAALADERTWRDVALIELELVGDGDDRRAEVWTLADGVWVYLGGVRVWWTGIGSAYVPVDADAFESVARGARTTADFLRVIPADVAAGSGTPAKPLRLQSVRLLAHPECAWNLTIPEDAEWVLQASDGSEPFAMEVDGASFTVAPDAALPLTLPEGTHTLRFPNGVPSATRALWLSRRPIEARPSGPAAASCSGAWRFVKTSERFVEGLSGSVDGHAVASSAADGFLAGYWLPPGVCGDPVPRNPWKTLGTASLAAGVVSLAVLVMLSLVGRIP